MKTDLLFTGGAEFSPCGRYRRLLWRSWDRRKPTLAAIMLNPSTADAAQDDPTVHRMLMRAEQMGFGGLRVGNLFMLRATDPKELARCDDPVGPDADDYLRLATLGARLVICGWGNRGVMPGKSGRPRCDEAVDFLVQAGLILHAIRLTKAGQPEHPLYLSYGLKPFVWRGQFVHSGAAP